MKDLLTITDNDTHTILPEVSRSYHSEAKRFLSLAKRQGELSPAVMEQLIDQLNTEGKSGSTINKHISAMREVIRTIFGTRHLEPAVRFELEESLKKIRFVKINAGDKRIGADQIILLHEYEALLDAAGSVRLSLVMEFLWETGVRINEALSIHLNLCRQMNEKVVIKVTGKGNKEREVRISKDLFERIDDTFRGNEYLFESSRTSGKKLDDRSVATGIRRLGENALDRTIGPHMFRHSFATRMISEGIDVKAVSEYLGHATSAITLDMYVHTRISDKDLGIG